MHNSLVFLLALVAVSFSQKLVDLKTFRGGNVQNAISGSAPFAIYVSAHSDSDSLLKQIKVVTPEQKDISLYDLKEKKLFMTSGELQPFAILSSAYLTTSLSDQEVNSLTGVMFISSTNQLQDRSFHVIDLEYNQVQSTYGLGGASATLLFLNTNMLTNPVQSSLFSNWKQDGKALVYMYRGCPTDQTEAKNTQIFSNPMHTYNFDGFFPNVEKFSLSMGAFYLRTTGSVQFSIGPGISSVDGTTTTAYTTTGFYQKVINQRDRTVAIHTKRDTTKTGQIGANTVGNLPTGGKVEVGGWDGDSHDSTSFPPTDSIFFWQSPRIQQDFKISSTQGQAGEFFVQYFVVQGGAAGQSTVLPGNPTVLPGRQTTARPGHIETTTKSSATANVFIPIMVFMLGYFQ